MWSKLSFVIKLLVKKNIFIGYFDIVVLSGNSFNRILPNNCLSLNLFVLTLQNILKELKS